MGRKCTDSDSGQAELRLEEFLPYRLSILAGRVSVSFAGIYKQRFGISIPEWRVLANLGQFAPLTAAELVQYSSMDKQILTTIAPLFFA